MTGLSRREKIILVLAAFAIALLISDKYILSPLMAKRVMWSVMISVRVTPFSVVFFVRRIVVARPRESHCS